MRRIAKCRVEMVCRFFHKIEQFLLIRQYDALNKISEVHIYLAGYCTGHTEIQGGGSLYRTLCSYALTGRLISDRWSPF